MPEIKEREQTDKVKKKVKKKGGGAVQRQAQHVMTVKLKKELVQRKQGGASSAAESAHDNFTDTAKATPSTTGAASADSNTEAVEQVEQITQTTVAGIGRYAEQKISGAISRTIPKQEKIKGQKHQPDQSQSMATPPLPSGPHEADTTSDLLTHQNQTTNTSTASSTPTPGERMRQQAANQRKEQLTHPRESTAIREKPIPPRTDTPTRQGQMADIPTSPSTSTPGERMRQWTMEQRKEQLTHPKASTVFKAEPQAAPHSGGPSAPTGPSIKNLSAGNQSIHPSIKERPRRSTVLKEKPQAGAIQPRTRRVAEQAARTRTAPTGAPRPMGKTVVTKRITDRARKKAQREVQRGMLQKSKQAAQATADLSKKAIQATAKAVKELISALAALVGGGTLAAAMCVIFLVAAVIASPFGILFANEPSPGAVPLNAAVNQINMELSNKLEVLQTGDHSAIDIQGTAPDWREVAAVFACKTAMGADSVDVAALTSDRVERLRAVFWDMCALSSSVETIDHEATDDTEAWTEKKLHITITSKSADDMRTAYLFSTDQNNTLTELLDELDVIGGLLANLGISDEKVIEVLQRLPDDLSPERRAVVETACKLVGKVNYFWGGKSSAIGGDPRWAR